MAAPEATPDAPHSDEQPPAFASWKALYTAALVSAALVMLLIALFSRFEF